jgi:hypothetical protein
MNKIVLTLFSLLLTCFSFAQDSVQQTSEQATGLRADEKIYVVIAVLLTILLGFFIYVFRLDRKVSKLENAMKASETL